TAATDATLSIHEGRGEEGQNLKRASRLVSFLAPLDAAPASGSSSSPNSGALRDAGCGEAGVERLPPPPPPKRPPESSATANQEVGEAVGSEAGEEKSEEDEEG